MDKMINSISDYIKNKQRVYDQNLGENSVKLVEVDGIDAQLPDQVGNPHAFMVYGKIGYFVKTRDHG